MSKSSMNKYILKDHKPVICSDVLVWAKWFEENSNRHIARTEIGDVVVSTVFMAIDNNFGSGPPILWETMVFLKTKKSWPEDLQERLQERCSGSWEQAEEMHLRMVEKVKKEHIGDL